MADDVDMIDRGSRYGTKQINTPYKEIAPDVYAEMFALAGAGRMGVVVHNIATNGDVFPVDSATQYEYDSNGVNITSLERTTPEGVTYRQTWIRNEMGQLQTKSGWVRL